MGLIFYIMGKSSSGKDTLYRELLAGGKSGLRTLIPYTTRPMRAGEVNGREYFFTDEEELARLKAEGRVIEERVYQTWYGPWHYFTVDDGRIDWDREDCLLTGTLESFRRVRDYFGRDRVVPLYIELDDGERLQRALNRERAQEEPKYEEMCRRFLADAEDFREEKIREAGIMRRFQNDDLEKCLERLRRYMDEEKEKGACSYGRIR